MNLIPDLVPIVLVLFSISKSKLYSSAKKSLLLSLITQGIPRERIVSVIGYGPDKPIASNETPAGRIANRRVEVIILKE